MLNASVLRLLLLRFTISSIIALRFGVGARWSQDRIFSDGIIDDPMPNLTILQAASACLLLLAFLFQPTTVTSIREVDERISKFLFASDPAAKSAVVEYQLHLAPEEDYEQKTLEEHKYDHKIGDVSDYESTKHIRPYFLVSQIENPRVVMFYSPWSGESQNVKFDFLNVAREVKRRQQRQPHSHDGGSVEFHAISCSAHTWVCHNYDIKSYPTIKAYKAGWEDGISLQSLTVNDLGDALEIHIPEPEAANESELHVDMAQEYDNGDEEEEDREHDFHRPHLDILSASHDGNKRTQSDLYKDAALSFIHSLRIDIYPSEDAQLTQEQKSAFVEWVDLLYWTLPPTWKLHTLIQDLRIEIDMALESHANLIRFIEQHSDVVLGRHSHWSQSCSHGRHGEGYSCGMWSLLHIASVGVAERHKAVLGGRERKSTAHIALTICNYIKHFFRYVCGHHCQSDFVAMYDKCGFNHCKRLKQVWGGKKKNIPPPESTWRELALWLFDIHNDVSMKLLSTEVAVRYNRRKLTIEEKDAATWPSQEKCKACRNDKKGEWDYDMVFEHIRTEYWPGGVHNWRYVVLDKNKYEYYDRFRIEIRSIVRIVLIIVVIFLIFDMARQQYLLRTGRHKKFDDLV